MNKSALIVIGMHRSGTSVLANGMNTVLGLSLGDNLIGPMDDHNPKGYFEDADINTFNNELLSKLDSSWHSLAPVSPEVLESSFLRDARDRAGQLLLDKIQNQRFFCFKDPRVTVLLPFWQGVLADLGWGQSYALALRNPKAVVQSLTRRDKFPREKSYYLWLKHQMAAVHFTEGCPRIVVSYENMLADPDREMRRIAAALDLPLPEDYGERFQQFAGDFIDKGLQRAIATVGDLDMDSAAPPVVKAVYALLGQAADSADMESAEFVEAWNSLDGRWRDIRLLCGFTDKMEHAAGLRLQDEMSEELARIKHLEAALAAAQEYADKIAREIEQSRARVEQLGEEVKHYRAEFESAQSREAALHGQLAEARSWLEELKEQARAARSEADAARAAAETARAETAFARAETEAARGEISHVRAASETLRMQAGLAQAEAQRADQLQAEAQERVGQLLAEAQDAHERMVRAERETQEARGWAEKNFADMEEARNWAEHLQAHLDKTQEDAGWMLIELWKAGARKLASNSRYPWKRHARIIGGSGLFDKAYYLGTNPDVAGSGEDPLKHFARHGWWELRNPNPDFDMVYYVQGHRDVMEAFVNPLVHYIEHGREEGRSPVRPPEPVVVEAEQASLRPMHPMECACLYEDKKPYDGGASSVDLIAFYLPQFHPIPENDEWWGEGFTEWTNVTRAVPLFAGHEQPKLPGAMGYYDLRLVEVLEKQARLAKEFGIRGFCFHHYYFAGKRLLEKPVDNLLAHPEIDLPFMLCWANENWSRRWDGKEHDVLIAQNHTPEDDIAFLEDAARYFEDPRYIRYEGKPVFILYKAAQLPDAAATVRRWRDHWMKTRGEGLYIVMAQTFGEIDPLVHGFDAAVEFPPNSGIGLQRIEHTLDVYQESPLMQVYEYTACKDKQYGDEQYALFRTVFPSWDNTARKGNASHVFHHSQPANYAEWLRSAMQYTLDNHPEGRRICFVNAWNEWAEGACLEPDTRYGYAYLNETARALEAYPLTRKRLPRSGKVLIVSHDAHLGGAQRVIISLTKWLRKHTALDIYFFCLDGGKFLPEIAAMVPTVTMSQLENECPGANISDRLRAFCGGSPDVIYANSVGSGRAYAALKRLNAPLITHVHELEKSIAVYAGGYMDDVLKYTDHYVACSPAVEENLVTNRGRDKDRVDLICAHIDPLNEAPTAERKAALRRNLDIPADCRVVVGCGLGLFWRKGADLFIDLAERVLAKTGEDVRFYWVGEFDYRQDYKGVGKWKNVHARIDSKRLKGKVTFLGNRDNAGEWFEAADVFVLPSREDPFPLVCLEAAERGLPILCFDGAGGMPSFVEDDAGFVVPFGDVRAMAVALLQCLESEAFRARLGARAREKLLARHTADAVGPMVLEVIRKVSGTSPLVSVIVPNYDKEDYLEERLDSIFNQTVRDMEVVILDDCSTDGSLNVIKRYAGRPNVRLEVNARNAGVFAQWKKGIEMACGDLIWIAEADDGCEPEFLEKVLPPLGNAGVRLSYCDSRAVDGESVHLFFYKDMEYLTALSPDKWAEAYVVEAAEEVAGALAYRNTIPNISGVVFRKFDCGEWFAEAGDMRLAGDWLFHLYAINGGKVSYIPEPLNLHRRHDDTCTEVTRSSRDRFNEVVFVQKEACRMYGLPEAECRKCMAEARAVWEDIGCENDEFEEAYDLVKAD